MTLFIYACLHAYWHVRVMIASRTSIPGSYSHP